MTSGCCAPSDAVGGLARRVVLRARGASSRLAVATNFPDLDERHRELERERKRHWGRSDCCGDLHPHTQTGGESEGARKCRPASKSYAAETPRLRHWILMPSYLAAIASLTGSRRASQPSLDRVRKVLWALVFRLDILAGSRIGRSSALRHGG